MTFEKDIHWNIFEDYLRKNVLVAKTHDREVQKYKEWLEYIYDQLGIEPFNANRNELLPRDTQAPLYIKLNATLEKKYQYKKIRCSAISALRKYLEFREKEIRGMSGKLNFHI